MEINKFGQRSHITWTAEDLRKEREAEKEIQMRQYRGLTKEGKWVYGWYIEVNNRHFIIPETAEVYSPDEADGGDPNRAYVESIWGQIEVILKTIGQSIGRKDKNNTEIYKGDIVRLLTYRAHYTGEKDKYRQEIVTKDCSCGLNTNGMISIQREGQEKYEPQLEIIGNIHTTPELIEEKENE